MPDIDYADLPVNEDGTHVATLSPTGDPWWCPRGYLPFALEKGFTVNRGEEAGDGLFNPSAHTVDEVNTHLAAAYVADDVAEVERVLAAEAGGKNRTTITDPTNA